MSKKLMMLGIVAFVFVLVFASLALGLEKSDGADTYGSILTCRNSATCIEIDKIWSESLVKHTASLGKSLNDGRSDSDVYDPSKVNEGRWDDFCDVHSTECEDESSGYGSGRYGGSSGSGTWVGVCSAQESTEKSDIRGDASISAFAIDLILEEAGSPAVGSGKYFIQYGEEYGIDAAFALAFFRQESTYATDPGSKADERKSLGNIRCPNAPALADGIQTTSTGDWCAYDSWENSIKGWYNYITESSNYFPKEKYTLEEILPVYAPRKDTNDPDEYTKNVKTWVEEYREVQDDSCDGYISDEWQWDSVAISQVDDASVELLTMLGCMRERLDAGVGRISSISDKNGFDECQNSWTDPMCAHTRNSAHYGCSEKYSGSLGVDIGDEENSCALAKAAKACGAYNIIGPELKSESGGTYTYKSDLPGVVVECDQDGLWNQRSDHNDHIHATVESADGNVQCG
ncbi:glucosaminidase domain-containing protein [archaeon]|jgi:hypothetical protein|nr:glucosaminidase domain-containing protein [archaeon]MBT6697631.1 glucosaminidase domain-containing protein [archaeon]